MLYIMCLLVSFGVTALAYRWLLPTFRKMSIVQSVSEYSLDEFKDKPITPTMGGLIFLVVTSVVSLIFNLYNQMTFDYLLILLSFIGYGLIGFLDDYLIIKSNKNNGLKERQKLFLQIILAVIFYIFYQNVADPSIQIPFIAEPVYLGIFYGLLVLFMFVGSSNAVNLTDGMDGLAGGTSIIAAGAFFYFAYQQEQTSVAILLAALIGSLLGYLLYNKKPAQIMMGDVGSLSLGGLFAATAMVLKIELLLILIGLVFVIETLSVIIQISSVKLFKKRVFPYTPIHYSFTIKGVSEERTVLIFYGIGLLGAILAIVLGG